MLNAITPPRPKLWSVGSNNEVHWHDEKSGDDTSDYGKQVTGHAITDMARIRQFITAGKAVITLKSLKTGKHYTYRVAVTDNDKTKFFVSVATDYMEFKYIGFMVWGADGLFTVKTTAKSPYGTAWSPSFLGFKWFVQQLHFPTLPAALEVRHEGKCGRCARPLTHPESIDLGLGPDCAEMMGIG